MMDQMKTKVLSTVKLVGELLKGNPVELRPWVKKSLTSSTVWQRDTSKDTQPINLQFIFTKLPQLWQSVKLWFMTPKQKERESDDGRDAEDKSQHKGDWGSHAHADKVAEEMEPTLEQLQNAQAVINSQWVEEE